MLSVVKLNVLFVKLTIVEGIVLILKSIQPIISIGLVSKKENMPTLVLILLV